MKAEYDFSKGKRGAAVVALLTAVFVAVMFLAVRPLVARLLARSASAVARDVIALVLLGVLVSSLTTEAIGIHAIFGAFLLGAIIPTESALSGRRPPTPTAPRPAASISRRKVLER